MPYCCLKHRYLERAALGIGAALFVLGLSGCATYQSYAGQARLQMANGQPETAALGLKERALTDSDDQVVYLLEYATALQQAGRYKESVEAYLKAEELTEVKDYHSLSRISGSMLLSEGMVQYKGEDYEKVLINAMAALNFIGLEDLEAAQVECRKLNDKLYKYRFEAKKNYEQNPFAFYLSAMIWENSKNWDSAYIDYKKTFDVHPQLPLLKEDLIRSAWRARRLDEMSKWKKAFPEVKFNPKEDQKQGEVVLIVQQGWAPQKRPDPHSPRMPRLYPTPSVTDRAVLHVEGVGDYSSEVVSSVEQVAMKAFDDAYAALAAKRAAALATKAVVADQFRQKNQGLGDLLWLIMNISDQADLRQWLTLPETFQVARVRLPPGEYTVHAQGLTQWGEPSGEQSEPAKIKVLQGKKSFVLWRALK